MNVGKFNILEEELNQPDTGIIGISKFSRLKFITFS